MAILTLAEMQVISQQFRDAANNLTTNERAHFVDAIAEIFGVTNRRNAELWVTESTTRRNFINKNLGSMELEMRVAFAKAYLNQVEPTTPQKEARFTGFLRDRARRMRYYLAEDYTRKNASRIAISTAGWAMEYEADSSPSADIDDESIDEWDDLTDE